MEAESNVDHRNDEENPQEKIASLTLANEELHRHIELLKGQLRANGIEPVVLEPEPPTTIAATATTQVNPLPDSSPLKKKIHRRKNYRDPVNKAALDAAVEARLNNIDSNNNHDGPLIPEATVRRHAKKRRREEEAAALAAGVEIPPEVKTPSRKQESWNAHYRNLKQYQDVMGNCNVPVSYPSLGKWVNFQRTGYKRMQEGSKNTLGMTQERVELLNEIGFTWKVAPSPVPWEMRFLQLKEFKQKEKHCNVPQFYSEDPKLGIFVKDQRQQYKFFMEGKKSAMTQERINRLEAIGFRWNVLKPRKDKNAG